MWLSASRDIVEHWAEASVFCKCQPIKHNAPEWFWQPLLPASHHPPPPVGWDPHEVLNVSFHTAIFYLTCTESTRKTLQHASGTQRGNCLSTDMSLPWSVVSAEILVISRRAQPVHTLCLLAPVHPECWGAGGLLFWFGSLFNFLGRGLSNDRVGWGDRGPYFPTIAAE